MTKTHTSAHAAPQTSNAPQALDDSALDAVGAGSGEGYVLTEVQHSATMQAVRHKLFAVIDRTQF